MGETPPPPLDDGMSRWSSRCIRRSRETSGHLFAKTPSMRDVESGRRYRSSQVIRAINSLAGPEHAELLKQVLRVGTDAEAREFGAFYFRKHPSLEGARESPIPRRGEVRGALAGHAG